MNPFSVDYWLLLLLGVLLVSLDCLCSPVANVTEKEKTEPGGGFIVVAGGIDYYNEDSPNVFLLNTYTREWSSMADLPAATYGSQLFYADGKLLTVGGNTGPSSFLIYNSTAATWTALANLNQATGVGPCGVILAGSLYLIGGYSQGNATQVMNPFNFPNWVPGAQLQQSRYYCGAAILGNNIYTCGHQSTGADGKTCEKFDPASNSWSFIASMNDYRMGTILVALNGYLYAVGGNNLGTAERYDPAMNTWTYIQPVSEKSRTFSGAVTNGRLIYLVGGCDGHGIGGCSSGSETSIVEVYIPDSNKWIRLSPLPDARTSTSIAYLPHLPKRSTPI